MIDLPTPHRILTSRAFLQGSGNGDSLENVNPSPLPDGCLCWVIDQAAVYRFDKASTGPSSPPDVIPTIFGVASPGRWRRIQATENVAYGSLSAAAGSVAPAQGVYAPWPGAQTLQPSAGFSAAAGGGLQYDDAPTRAFRVKVTGVLGINSTPTTVEARLNVNGDPFIPSFAPVGTIAPNTGPTVTLEAIIPLATGDQVVPVAHNTASAWGYRVTPWTMTATPA
jgi:hypothetical protein